MSTFAPAGLELVVDLDRPTAGQLTNVFRSVDVLWERVTESIEERAGSADLPPTGLRLPRTPLRVQRLRLESPLEVALTAVTSTYAPMAYVLSGLALMERTVRLVMD